MPDTNTGALMSKFKSWQSYSNFAYRIRRQTRFIMTPEDQSFLRQVLQTSKSRIKELPKNTGLWRAQLGHTWRTEHQDCQSFEVQAAYCPKRMKPVEGCAAEGRANPKGIPVLYLSTRQDTAMSEVRPWLGSFVSCAQFRTTRPLSSTLYEFGQVSACNRPIASSPADRPEGFLPTRYRALMLKNTRPSTGAAVPLPKRR